MSFNDGRGGAQRQASPGGPVLGMVLKGFPRISETFISNEILLLEKLGFRIHIFSMRRGRENFSHPGISRIRARVDYLPETFLKNSHRLFFRNLRLAIRRFRPYIAGVKCALQRYRRSRNPATWRHFLQAGYLVEKCLPGRGVAHLHAHFAHSPTSVALYASILSGLSFSFTAHAKDIYTSQSEQLREKIARARFVATCTEYNRRHLLGLAAGLPTPIHRVYHGIDTAQFAAGSGVNAAPSPPFRILTVARLIAKKGIPTVLAALKLLSEAGVAFTYTLIGDGADRDPILGQIRHLGLEPVCRWLGTQPHPVVLDHYRRADLFVLGCEVAGDGDRDGIPNVVLESMGMGVPVVTTSVSAIPEVIASGETGLLVPPGRPGPLAEAMRTLLTDSGLRRRAIAAARERVLRDFDNTRQIGRLADLLGNALAKRDVA
jgi:glycosyltransferase involved in cell wall biosynthesis